MTDDVELRAAWGDHVGDAPNAWATFDDVVGRHRQAHRRYHGVRHVTWVVRHVHDLAAEVGVADLGAVVAAAFFHDAVYDPMASDNEAQSARLAERQLCALGWPVRRRLAVGLMIEATAAHAATDDPDTAVLLDADLAVLGSDPGRYQAYASGVRTEYGHIDTAGWRAGRAAVLEGLLAADPLYSTEAARQRWALRARANLTAELAGLR